MTPAPDVGERVVRAHAQTRITMRFALAFVAAAVVVGAAGLGRWLVLHLFLAGALVLAISGVSVMLTVTWATAPAPSDRWLWAQRLAIAVGVVGVGVGRQAELARGVVDAAAGLYLFGLAVLIGVLVLSARRASKRRFDPAVGAYCAAVVCGAVGVVIGLVMIANGPTLPLRQMHITANALGLVGLVIAGTMPFFAATVGRARMAPHARTGVLFAINGLLVVAVGLTAVGFGFESRALAATGLALYAVGVGAVVAVLPRPTVRQLQWAGPRVLALWAGGGWWMLAVAATAFDAAAGRPAYTDRWLVVLVVGAYAQIFWGSIAYLLPMLRGGGAERLSAGFATTRSWIGFGAANAAAGALVARWWTGALAAIALWVLDTAVRVTRVGTRKAERPPEASPNSTTIG